MIKVFARNIKRVRVKVPDMSHILRQQNITSQTGPTPLVLFTTYSYNISEKENASMSSH